MPRNKFFKASQFGLLLLLLSLPACTTNKLISARLPTEISINETAGRGTQLIIILRLESGEELPFMVDTGAPVTVFDKSLESKLGRPIGRTSVMNFGAKYEAGIYETPKLYLGNTQLKTGRYAVAIDMAPMYAGFEKYKPMGVLGMDCLRHYCIQLDFQSGKMRFLDPHDLDVADLGAVFPLYFSNHSKGRADLIYPYIHSANILGAERTNVLIDTGYRADGTVDSAFFRRKISEQGNQPGDVVRGDHGRVWFSKCTWNSGVYTNLLIGEGESSIGLGFLARHLVTFDFPDRVMYLKKNSTGELMDETMKAALAFLTGLKENGQLPGWSKNDEGSVYLEPFPDRDELDGRKNNDSSDYHYQVSRSPVSGGWKLQKAWQTDSKGDVIEEYPVP